MSACPGWVDADAPGVARGERGGDAGDGDDQAEDMQRPVVKAGQSRQTGEGGGRAGEAEYEDGDEQEFGPPAVGAGAAGVQA
jgi:hypothetical protein